MAETKTKAPQIDLESPSYYINRELSAIEFNRRVLNEAGNPEHPLLERVKFVAIFSSNMDEFFMVRVSGLKQQLDLGITRRPPDGLTPREQLLAIHRAVVPLYETKMNLWRRLKEELAAEDIRILDYDDLKPKHVERLRDYFDSEIYPVLTPLAFDPGRPFPHISNLSLNLAVLICDPETNLTKFARVKVPATLPRLVPLKRFDPSDLVLPSQHKFVRVEQVIAANLDRLFKGMEIVAAHPFRITRNTDMDIQEEEADDLLLTIERGLRQRHFGSVVRLEIDEEMPDAILETLQHNLSVDDIDVYRITGPLGLSSLWELHRLERPDLKDEPFYPTFPAALRDTSQMFNVLRRQDVLLYRPYGSFDPVIEFVQQAAEDPQVLAIKMTLYRVGSRPPIVEALMRARENGKQVAVLVELKARFDEESNIEWARALEEKGVHVVYGLIGLKTHAKVTLVVRREESGIRRYLHLATGNYNATTARLYTDLDLLTSHAGFGEDASDVFNILTGYSKQREFREFLVAPYTVRDRIIELIEAEAARGADGHIIMKCNSLVDKRVITALYRASQAGTPIDLIIRGICCLRPGIKGVSENIRVISVVGRFLEHSRVYYFENEGDPIVYVGSADMMPRNLDRRVEVVFPIHDPSVKGRIIRDVLQRQLADNALSHELQSDGSYVSMRSMREDSAAIVSSQALTLDAPAPILPLGD